MVGSKISVAVMDADGNSDLSDETEEVGVYEALEILSAEQIAKDKVQVTFSAPATADDKLTVKKGATEQSFTEAFDDDTYLTKTLTFKNNLATGTYTVTLTPADEDVDPSSVEFEAKSSTKANRLEIENKYLVMKDGNFKEGYFFIKGYNEFDEEINLSGLTLNVAPSDSVSYDSSTGKVTVKYANPGYAVVKNVSVFAQYTGKNGDIVTCQETLEVTTIGYPSEIEFGDVKKDGTPRADGRITIAELGSNKYYVELNSVKDQYGNELSAKDLNDLKTAGFLTVIPDANSPIYFGTNATPFTTKGDKVVVFLTPSNGLPGAGQLMITGAGGTFSKDILIEDDPYIASLSVTVPDLYENAWSDEFSFEAVDQYGDEINLYDFVPADGEYPQILTFKDMNHQVVKRTTITAEARGTWKVKKDTVKKTFKITYLPNGTEKSIVTFTTLPAGLLATNVQTATIGAKGKGALIVPQTSAATIEFGGTSNINSYIQFKDANGKIMDRLDPANARTKYPKFIGGANANGIKTNAKIADKDIDRWVWTVSKDKLAEDSTQGGTGNTTALAAGKYDADGVIDGSIANAANVLGVSRANPVANYYVTLLGGDGTNYKVLDSQTFRFVYVPTSLNNVKYKVNDTSKMLLYAAPDSEDKEEIKVTATNDAGESWTVPAAQISLTPEAPFTSTGNLVNGNIAAKQGKGTLDVKVYVDSYDAREGIIAVDTVKIAYDDADPVATSTSTGLETTDEATNGTVPEGSNWKPDGVLDLTSGAAAANVTMDNGAFKITKATVWGDTFTASIKDQYGVTMKDSTVKMNGYEMGVDPADALAYGEKGNFVITNGTQKIDLDLTSGAGGVTINKAVGATSTTAKNQKSLERALDKAYGNGTHDTIILDDPTTFTLNNTLQLEAGDTLILSSDADVTTKGGDVINGTLINNGGLTLGGNMSIGTTGSVTNNADFDGGANTVTVAAGGKFMNNDSVTGTGKITGQGTYVNNAGAETVLNGATSEIDMSAANTLENFGTVKAGTIKGYVLLGDNSKTTANEFHVTQVEVKADSVADLTEGTTTLEIDTNGTGAKATITGSADNSLTLANITTEASKIEDGNGDPIATSGTDASAKFTIAYDANGGSGEIPAVKDAELDDQVKIPETAPTRTGYAFLGWATEKKAKEPDITGSTKIQDIAGTAKSGDTITLYAVWTEKTYEITFEAGAHAASDPDTMEVQVITYSQATATDANITPTANGFTAAAGYHFDKWKNGSEDVAASANLATMAKDAMDALTGANAKATVTLTAQWALNSYTVTFESNGGDGGMTSMNDAKIGDTITANEYTKTGSTFAGWSLAADGNKIADDQATINANIIGDTQNGGTITLFALWQ